MKDSKIKVLYIAGWGRSGSTILARILGQIDGFFHGGELRTIWTDGLKPGGLCGCGVPVKECPIWTSVFQEGFSGLKQINIPEIIQLRRQTEPRTQEILLSQFIPSQKERINSRLNEYLKVLEKLYTAIHNVTQSRVIVDDSNHPGYAYSLAQLPNIDLSVVHLIRDPRATAYSWSQRQKKGLGTYSIRDNSLGWMLRNLAVEALPKTMSLKYLRLFYEDFASQPKLAIQKILEMLQETSSELPFITDNEVELGISHTVFGNPNRTQTGTVKIKLDDEWKRKLDKVEQIKVDFLTLPLLVKYGYW